MPLVSQAHVKVERDGEQPNAKSLEGAKSTQDFIKKEKNNYKIRIKKRQMRRLMGKKCFAHDGCRAECDGTYV